MSEEGGEAVGLNVSMTGGEPEGFPQGLFVASCELEAARLVSPGVTGAMGDMCCR